MQNLTKPFLQKQQSKLNKFWKKTLSALTSYKALKGYKNTRANIQGNA